MAVKYCPGFNQGSIAVGMVPDGPGSDRSLCHLYASISGRRTVSSFATSIGKKDKKNKLMAAWPLFPCPQPTSGYILYKTKERIRFVFQPA
jgi:hypothetical protein